jgi:hypothetical protein
MSPKMCSCRTLLDLLHLCPWKNLEKLSLCPWKIIGKCVSSSVLKGSMSALRLNLRMAHTILGHVHCLQRFPTNVNIWPCLHLHVLHHLIDTGTLFCKTFKNWFACFPCNVLHFQSVSFPGLVHWSCAGARNMQTDKVNDYSECDHLRICRLHIEWLLSGSLLTNNNQ